MKSTKKNIKHIVATAAFVVASLAANATFTNGSEKNTGSKDTPVEIRYIGKIKEQPVLQIQFANTAGEEVMVILKDTEGTVLYYENFKGKLFSKKFMFEGEDASNLQIEVVINSKKTNQSQFYSINKNARIVNEMVVSKL